ncbi:MAG TPA: hypothetical protein VMW56_30405 [Candidatus Margulisiibacteriota bacterium]|nr:hypothetical protein [Candidatus Margulisiibacteriota bacterium]
MRKRLPKNRLMLPDALLPAQFFDTVRSPSKKGEFQLLMAVLQDAIKCFQTYALAGDRHGRRLFREAETWIMGDAEKEWSSDATVFLSFEYVCDVLSLDSSAVRSTLAEWYQQQRRADVRR